MASTSLVVLLFAKIAAILAGGSRRDIAIARIVSATALGGNVVCHGSFLPFSRQTNTRAGTATQRPLPRERLTAAG